jgi:hypothetical protein
MPAVRRIVGYGSPIALLLATRLSEHRGTRRTLRDGTVVEVQRLDVDSLRSVIDGDTSAYSETEVIQAFNRQEGWG